MPLGNGDIGLNLWVEPDGDVLFYLSKTDAWDENGRLVKLGRIRLHLEPSPLRAGLTSRQILWPHDGLIRIEAGPASGGGAMTIWVDAHRPEVRIQGRFDAPVSLRASLELWRSAERPLADREDYPIGGRSSQDRGHVWPDIVVLDARQDEVIWCHRNETSVWRETLEHQDLSEWIPHGRDPLLHRTFGAILLGENLVRQGDRTLVSNRPSQRVDLAVFPLTAQTPTLDEYVRLARASAARCRQAPTERAFAEHLDWWHGFWERSGIQVDGGPEAETVTRGYQLQRFMNACAGRGAYPIKFNGSIFTFDARHADEDFDADYRRWGGGYWFQNTRLVYWSMVMAGDLDLMQPWFRMYLDALPLARFRTRRHFGHEGAIFPETMTFWGSYLNVNYGYDRRGRKAGEVENRYIRRYWQGMLELLAIMLDVYDLTQEDDFVRQTLLPLATEFIAFYRGAYPRRAGDGTVLFSPSQALETWHEAVNPLPDIAGLGWVLEGLLRLPPGLVPPEQTDFWSNFRRELPSLPKRTYSWQKRTELIPALQYDVCANSENVALYAVFPYRLYGLGKPDLETALATWEGRPNKATGGWRQDAIQAAMLGLANEAWADVLANFSTPYPAARFPAFWGPNADWIPDQDHGAVAMIALQRMLMQCEGRSILALPAWPKDWDVRFKLHAPGRTVVELDYRRGRVERLEVTPPQRRDDVVFPPGVSGP
jgi:hypothetical protein